MHVALQRCVCVHVVCMCEVCGVCVCVCVCVVCVYVGVCEGFSVDRTSFQSANEGTV